jgi:hypothetical protein
MVLLEWAAGAGIRAWPQPRGVAHRRVDSSIFATPTWGRTGPRENRLGTEAPELFQCKDMALRRSQRDFNIAVKLSPFK